MRGEHFGVLPRDHRAFVHHGERFFFSDGVWYRSVGPRYVVVAPPVGLIIPFLPPYYATIWVGGFPYYYANDVYYAPAAGGYMVVSPPQGEVSQIPRRSRSLLEPGAKWQIKSSFTLGRDRTRRNRERIDMSATSGLSTRPVSIRSVRLLPEQIRRSEQITAVRWPPAWRHVDTPSNEISSRIYIRVICLIIFR